MSHLENHLRKENASLCAEIEAHRQTEKGWKMAAASMKSEWTRENAALVARLAEVEADGSALRARVSQAENHASIAKAREKAKDERIRELEVELSDIKEAWPRIMADECAKDEKHCTCLPALRLAFRDLLIEIRPYLPSESDILDYAATNEERSAGPGGVLVRKVERYINLTPSPSHPVKVAEGKCGKCPECSGTKLSGDWPCGMCAPGDVDHWCYNRGVFGASAGNTYRPCPKCVPPAEKLTGTGEK